MYLISVCINSYTCTISYSIIECDAIWKQKGRKNHVGGRCLSYDKSKREKWEEWSHYVMERISFILDRENPLPMKEKQWKVRVRDLVHVKSYAPHVDHLVADVECRPVNVY